MTPPWGLAAAALLSGAGMLWIFRRTCDVQALAAAVNRIQAHLLEFWLYVDEPRAILKSWRGLLGSNGRLLRLLLRPLATLSLAALPLFVFLHAIYGTWPLAVDRPAVVTVALSERSIPQLQELDGVSVETPPVRVPSLRQVSWRIRPRRPLDGELQFTINGETLTKSIHAGGSARFHSPRRSRSLLAWMASPVEARLPAGPVEWIAVSYPRDPDTHWLLWFTVFSLAGALLTHFIAPRLGTAPIKAQTAPPPGPAR